MTHFIGDVEIPVIQNVDISTSSSVDEIEMVEQDDHLLYAGEESAPQIEIEFALVESLHRGGKIVEEQRKEVESLVESKSTQNIFTYNIFNGRIAVEEVSIPESSDSPTYREGTIKGKYLAWPKHYPNFSLVTLPEVDFGRYFGRYFGR